VYVLVATSEESMSRWIAELCSTGKACEAHQLVFAANDKRGSRQSIVAPVETQSIPRAGDSKSSSSSNTSTSRNAVWKMHPDSQKEGYLMKLGGIFKNWKIRYFVLRDSWLTYYKSKTRGAKPLGKLNLIGARMVGESSQSTGKSHSFSVKPMDTSRTYIFVAASAAEQAEWMKRIDENILVLFREKSEDVLNRAARSDTFNQRSIDMLKAKQSGVEPSNANTDEAKTTDGSTSKRAKNTIDSPSQSATVTVTVTADKKNSDAIVSVTDEAAEESTAFEHSVSVTDDQVQTRDRNDSILDLRARMLHALNNDEVRFIAFRKQSWALLQGQITCVEYMRVFFRTFSRHDAVQLFPDLVSAVPDKNKRKTLRSLYARLAEKLKQSREQQRRAYHAIDEPSVSAADPSISISSVAGDDHIVAAGVYPTHSTVQTIEESNSVENADYDGSSASDSESSSDSEFDSDLEEDQEEQHEQEEQEQNRIVAPSDTSADDIMEAVAHRSSRTDSALGRTKNVTLTRAQLIEARTRHRLEELKLANDAEEAEFEVRLRAGSMIQKEVMDWRKRHGKTIQALLSSLHEVLPGRLEAGELAVEKVADARFVKRNYHLALKLVHPDKMQTASVRDRILADAVYHTLRRAFEKYSKAQKLKAAVAST
jgi:PH domain